MAAWYEKGREIIAAWSAALDEHDVKERVETAMERGTRIHLEAGQLMSIAPGYMSFPEECGDLAEHLAARELKRARQASMPNNFGHPPRTYDGLTAAECLKRYESWQRGDRIDGVAFRTREGGNRPLTPSQLTAARELWSSSLRTRVEASTKADAERERNQVVCDDPDYYEGL